MLLENIKLLDYKKENTKLIVTVNSNIENIKKELNNKTELSIYTDNLETRYLVETLFGYSRIISIKENVINNTYEVEIVKENDLELQLLNSKNKIKELEEDIINKNARIDDLEICVLELADVVGNL